jgi:hypothetical protein
MPSALNFHRWFFVGSGIPGRIQRRAGGWIAGRYTIPRTKDSKDFLKRLCWNGAFRKEMKNEVYFYGRAE